MNQRGERESEREEKKEFCDAVVLSCLLGRGKKKTSLRFFLFFSQRRVNLSLALLFFACSFSDPENAALGERTNEKEKKRRETKDRRDENLSPRLRPPPLKKKISYDKGGVPSVTLLSQVPSYSAASGVLERGDIVFAVNGTLLRDDTALFSLAADRAVAANATLPVTVFRHGERLELNVPVRDANAEKITRFARFAGGVFHDLKGLQRWKYGGGGNVVVEGGGDGDGNNNNNSSSSSVVTINNGTGLFLSYAAPGSTWSELASSSGADSDLTKRLILSVNGRDTQAGGLDEFIKAAKEIKDGDEGFVVARNPLAVSRPAGVASKVAFNTRYDPLEVFEWDERSKEWKQVKV